MNPAPVNTLELIKDDPQRCWNGDSSMMLNGLSSAITKFEFIITVVVVANCMNYILSATQRLQRKEMDIMKILAEIDLIQSRLHKVREDTDYKHQQWFQ